LAVSLDAQAVRSLARVHNRRHCCCGFSADGFAGVIVWDLASAMVVAPAVVWGASWPGSSESA